MDGRGRSWTDSEKIQLLAEVHSAMTTASETMELLTSTINGLSPTQADFRPPWEDVNWPGAGRSIRESQEMLTHLLRRRIRPIDSRSPYQEPQQGISPAQQTLYRPSYTAPPPPQQSLAGARHIQPKPTPGASPSTSSVQSPGEGAFHIYLPGIGTQDPQSMARKRGRPSNEQKEMERQRAEAAGEPWPPPRPPRKRPNRSQAASTQSPQGPVLNAFGPNPQPSGPRLAAAMPRSSALSGPSTTSAAPPGQASSYYSPRADEGSLVRAPTPAETQRRSPATGNEPVYSTAGAQEPAARTQTRESTHYDPARGANVPSIMRRPEGPPPAPSASYSSQYQPSAPYTPPAVTASSAASQQRSSFVPPPRGRAQSPSSPRTTRLPKRDDETMEQ